MSRPRRLLRRLLPSRPVSRLASFSACALLAVQLLAQRAFHPPERDLRDEETWGRRTRFRLHDLMRKKDKEGFLRGGDISTNATVRLPYLDRMPEVTQKLFEEQARNIPDIQTGLSRCPNCHLNRSCFDYPDNMWHPSGCRSRQVDSRLFAECFDDGKRRRGRRTLLLAGDSRLRQVEREIASLADPEDNIHIMTSALGNKYHQFNAIAGRGTDSERLFSNVSESARILMQREDFRYSVASMVFTCDHFSQQLIGPLLKLSREEGKKFLFIGWNGAWAVLEPQVTTLDPELLMLSVTQCQKSWKKFLKVVEFFKTEAKDMEVVYIMDTLPVKDFSDELTEKGHRVMMRALKRHIADMLGLLKTEFPFIKVMDSHIYANQAYVQICDEGKLERNYRMADPEIEVIFEVSKYAWLCDSRWHPGRLHQAMVAQLILNHVCFGDE